MYTRTIFKNIGQIPGWSTNRKLVVIESDDWGSVRMPSRTVFKELNTNGVDLESDEGYLFNKYDSLANEKDLAGLFEVLSSVRDIHRAPAVFTPVTIVANPDFKKISDSDFGEYHYEIFTETLKRYPACGNSFALWKKGIESGLFIPQFHGREHLNVLVWMGALQAGDPVTIRCFNHGFWGVSTAKNPAIKVEFQAAFDFLNPKDLNYQKEVLISGLDIFENLFGYRATYYTPPNGIFSSKLEHVCFENGIKFIAFPKMQVEPLGYGKTRRRLHWLGQKNNSGLVSDIRNCFFEPVDPSRDWVDSCLSEISIAFRWRKPAIISSHRVNYIGALYEENRENGLRKLKLLLNKIVKHWPSVEFVSSDKLAETIIND